MYEICREYNGEEWEGFEIDDEIVMALEDLAAGVAVGGGSVKESAKKERKAQRTSFRHILVKWSIFGFFPHDSFLGIHSRLWRSTNHYSYYI